MAGVVAGGGSLTTRGNVTVTPINMTNASNSNCQFSYSANGVRISVPSEELRTHSNLPIDDEDSNDAEVSKIDFLQYQVNMRNKKKRPSSSVQTSETTQDGGERERPMSWEGELSDTEMADALTGDGEDDSCQPKAESESESRDLSVKEEPVAAGSFQGREDRDALDLKYASVPQHSLHFHQRSLSMNRICVVTESGATRRCSPERGRPPSAAPPPVPTAPDGYQAKLEQHVLQQQQIQQQQQQQTMLPELKCEPGALVEKLLGSLHGTPSGSPLLPRQPRVLSNASNDSAIHSMYTHSVYSSPSASPGASRHGASLSRNNSDASHSSCYSYSSEFSPTHSPVQGRHGVLFREAGGLYPGSGSSADPSDTPSEPDHLHQGISRQQLINSPCPICGDKISGFHYGIFSCESCKGFFKRTVQNRKNYVCLRGANCPVTVATRKKCPACRFDKCLHCGMKLEAIREDRTRGGRSTYQCSYTLSGAASTGSLLAPALPAAALRHATSLTSVNGASTPHGAYSASRDNSGRASHDQSLDRLTVPSLLQEIMDVEHLWQYNESELSRLKSGQASGSTPNPLLAGGPDFLANLCNIADHRLYKIVKWCKSLPLFKNISIDDQICLLINSWCELLVLSCCYRGVGTPGEVRVGSGRGITLHQSDKLGLSPCIERMLHFTDHLRRLRVDRYEYVALKVIVLLTSDALELKEPEKVRASQERALAALQAYTAAHYPDTPAKFGELLLRIPELQRTCQVGKEMLNPSNKSKDGEGSSFNLLMELLRGDH